MSLNDICGMHEHTKNTFRYIVTHRNRNQYKYKYHKQ